MKKIAVIILALALAFVFVGCGSKTPEGVWYSSVNCDMSEQLGMDGFDAKLEMEFVLELKEDKTCTMSYSFSEKSMDKFIDGLVDFFVKTMEDEGLSADDFESIMDMSIEDYVRESFEAELGESETYESTWELSSDGKSVIIDGGSFAFNGRTLVAELDNLEGFEEIESVINTDKIEFKR